MKIAIWTTRAPKVEWIKQAINESPFFKDIKQNIEYILLWVPFYNEYYKM